MVLKRRVAVFGLGFLALSTLALLTLWLQRKPIAKDYLDGFLSKKGVSAQYDLVAIGTKRQRLENIVLGDPANPDLTADWAEVDVALLSGGTVRAVRAGGVRIKGRLIDGILDLGSVSKLLPQSDGSPFALPDIDVSLDSAGLALDTGKGALAIGLAGQGNLSDGFAGQIVAKSASIGDPACRATKLDARGSIRIVDGRPAFSGPLQTGALACNGAAASALSGTLDLTLGKSLDAWEGVTRLSAKGVTYGSNKSSNAQLSARFSGNERLTRATYQADLSGVALPQGQAGTARLAGSLDLGSGNGRGVIIASSGTINAARVTAAQGVLKQAQSMRRTASGTPVAPIARAMADALYRLGQGSAVSAGYELDQRDGKGTLALSNVVMANPGGARVEMRGPASVRVRWPGSRLDLTGTAKLAGGGFPATDVAFTGTGIAGRALVAPMAADGARLSLTPVRFDFNRGMRLETVMLLDGPLGSGSVKGVRIPLAIAPGRDVLSGCHDVRFESLEISGLRLAPATLATCLSPNGARINAPRLAGKLGNTGIGISAQSANFGFARGDFSVASLGVRLATQPASVLDVAGLAGSLSGGGASGSFGGASGQLGAVPMALSDVEGGWSFGQGGEFRLSGTGQIADAVAERRFNPLVASDIVLTLRDGRIDASTLLIEPKSREKVARVDLFHLLEPGTGQATIAVDDLNFGNQLQPEMITPITLGVIANVVGRVDGTGKVFWSPRGVTSQGGFKTDMLDFAAAFGPVSGLKGEIRLSDLLGMSTPPSQSVSIRSINPGIAVIDGEIRYQLLPGLKAQVEGGRWPFAGGYLILDPTIIDMAHEAERRFTFRVEGIDAAAFVNQLQFENIAATGTFDGTLPMIFDARGGRIEGGQLVARAGGGTLAYVGELSNENLGAMGSFAFDALKSMKYERLTIDLGGPIDGDIVTRVSFKGVNQAPVGLPRKKLPIPIKIVGLDNIPFIFNITITAPFRKLFDMSRTISDPSLLLERLNPRLERVGPAKTIQPSESQDVRKKP